MPVFSELLEKGERARAWRVASTVFWLLLLVVGGVTALFILAAPVLMPPLTDAYDDLTVTLSQILFPIVVLLGLFGIVTGILNSYDDFSVPALTPVSWNLAIIAGLVFGVPRADTETREALRLRRLDPDRHRDPAPAAAAVAPRSRRPPSPRARPA